ncbi:MAG: hypothetical protein Q4E89_06090 [Eubacteriales bacterium]|nr:hypothetical protein [Eubacteriales bacterium]
MRFRRDIDEEEAEEKQETKIDYPKDEYHQIHCPVCGKVISASELAIDFGVPVHKALKIQREIDEIWEDNIDDEEEENASLSFLESVNMRLYLSIGDLQKIYHLEPEKEGNFELTVGLLKDHFCRLLYPEQDRDFETIFRDFDSYLKKLGRIEANKLKQRIAQMFCVTREKDFNLKAAYDKNLQILRKLYELDEQPIAQFRVKIRRMRDTKSQEILEGVEITYQQNKNGQEEKETITAKICTGFMCGHTFYRNVGKYKEIVIGMMGSARVGKTAYLAALINQITSADSLIQVSDRSDEGYKDFEENIVRPYRSMKKIRKTEESAEIIPLFSIVLKINEQPFAFIFVDMPGEVWDRDKKDNFIINQRRILQYVDLMWLCIAPEQTERVRWISDDGGEDAIETDMVKVMENMEGVYNDVPHEHTRQAAVLITMSDKIYREEEPIFEPDVRVMEEYVEDNKLKLDSMREHNRKIKRFLDEKANQNIVDNGARVIRQKTGELFERVNYFAVAAYGAKPDEATAKESRARSPQPSMIELPFLWSLCVVGCLDAVTRKWIEPEEEDRGFFGKLGRILFHRQDEELEEVWDDIEDQGELFQL